LLLQGSVREQLEALCDLSTVCAPAQLRKQREANKQLRSEVKTLRMQLQRSQSQNQRLQQQLKAAQAASQKD
jgi:predicted outer membrane protein